MRLLIGCEKSGIVREAFRARGIDAWSCDTEPSQLPGPHIQADLLQVMKKENFDAGIFHPECKYLCFSGERWIKERPGREDERLQAFDFFKACFNAPMKYVAVENSHSVFLKKQFRKPTQTIHPYHFGDPYKKSTCLWLRGFPPLVPTNILAIGHRYPAAWLESPAVDRSAKRAQTYPGIAAAMAAQWGDFLLSKFKK
jgi:hypothetical protein